VRIFLYDFLDDAPTSAEAVALRELAWEGNLIRLVVDQPADIERAQRWALINAIPGEIIMEDA
jgi:hypothetical protein